MDKYRLQRTRIVDLFIKPHLREGRIASYAEQSMGEVSRSLGDFSGWVSQGLQLYGDKELEVIDSPVLAEGSLIGGR